MSMSLWKRCLLQSVVGMLCFAAAGQSCQAQYVPGGYLRNYGYVSPYGWGGGGYGGGMTAQMGAGIGYGAAMRGLGDAAKADGAYEIESQQANYLYMQAYQEYLKTLNMQHDTYQKLMNEHQAEYQARVAKDRASVDAYKKDMATKAAPTRLTSDQFDRSSNVIYWPMVLRDSMFDADRFTIDKLFHERTKENSGSASDNYAEIQKACDAMLKRVGQDVHNLDIYQYITARHFITSLEYEGRFQLN